MFLISVYPAFQWGDVVEKWEFRKKDTKGNTVWSYRKVGLSREGGGIGRGGRGGIKTFSTL